MFYATDKNEHGLRFNPFKALVVPRPVGWISTLSENGTPNLAPFSFFNAISDNPPMIMFSVGGSNDTLKNIEATKQCTCSFASKSLIDAMNMSSAGVDGSVSEFSLAGIESAESEMVKPARVAASPAALECRHWKSIELPPRANGSAGYTMVIAEVVGVYIDDAFIKDGILDTAAMKPISRLGYMDYAVIDESNMFSLNRPVTSEDGLSATLNAGPWDGKY
jgi:flavin reductase (DIM6/NTAB) family NADH-FMN oxidoreductase RutF